MLLLMKIFGAESWIGIEAEFAEFEGGCWEFSVSCEAECSYLLSLVKIESIFWIKSCGIGRNLFSTIFDWGNISIYAWIITCWRFEGFSKLYFLKFLNRYKSSALLSSVSLDLAVYVYKTLPYSPTSFMIWSIFGKMTVGDFPRSGYHIFWTYYTYGCWTETGVMLLG